MLLIPKSVGAIASVASKDTTRENLTGVHVRQEADGSALVEACDSSRLIRVILPKEQVELASNFPVIAGLDPKANGQTEGIIPVDAWRGAFKAVPKRTTMPILQNVALTMHEGNGTLATTDLAQATTFPVTLVTGTYPCTDNVFPQTEPVLEVSFDATMLADTLRQVAAIAEHEKRGGAVKLTFYGANLPVLITTGKRWDASVKVAALVMPMRGYE